MPGEGSRILFVEPVPVPDIFVSGIASVQHASGRFRFTYYADDTNPDGTPSRIIRARLVITEEDFLPALYDAANAAGMSLMCGVAIRGKH